MNSTHAKKFVELVRGKASCKIVIVMQIHFYTVLYVFATEKKIAILNLWNPPRKKIRNTKLSESIESV